MKWVINLFKKQQDIRVGSIVRTRLGVGTVIGGTLHIKYDGVIYTEQPSNKTRSHNLDELVE